MVTSTLFQNFYFSLKHNNIKHLEHWGSFFFCFGTLLHRKAQHRGRSTGVHFSNKLVVNIQSTHFPRVLQIKKNSPHKDSTEASASSENLPSSSKSSSSSISGCPFWQTRFKPSPKIASGSAHCHGCRTTHTRGGTGGRALELVTQPATERELGKQISELDPQTSPEGLWLPLLCVFPWSGAAVGFVAHEWRGALDLLVAISLYICFLIGCNKWCCYLVPFSGWLHSLVCGMWRGNEWI